MTDFAAFHRQGKATLLEMAIYQPLHMQTSSKKEARSLRASRVVGPTTLFAAPQRRYYLAVGV
jgi:hypothetical protein